MIAALLALLSASAEAPCQEALLALAEARLSKAHGPWRLTCLDDSTVEIARWAPHAGQRSRRVRLADVSAALRLELIYLSSLALTHDEAPAPAPRPTRFGLFTASEGSSGVALRGAFDARWLPVEGTWLLGGSLGLGWRWLMVGLRAAGGSSGSIRAASIEGFAALSLACVGGPRVSLCARGELGAGAANVAISSASAWTFWSQLTAGIEAAVTLGRVSVGLSTQLGGAIGPRALMAGAPGPAWAGLLLGATTFVEWQ